MPLALVILAAGKGTRMHAQRPKVMHTIAGGELIRHVLAAGRALDPEKIVVVVGSDADELRALLARCCPEATLVVQQQARGTGHAAVATRSVLESFDGNILVLCGDTPLINSTSLQQMRERQKSADLTLLGFNSANPKGYGRIIANGSRVLRIVESTDATGTESDVGLCNAGVVMCGAARLFNLLEQVQPAPTSREIYLTAIAETAARQGLLCSLVMTDEDSARGVNNQAELAAAEALFQARIRARLMEAGVVMPAPDTVHLAFDTNIAGGVRVEPYVVFGPGVSIAEGAEIRSFSHIEGANIGLGAVVGPFARLRPGTQVGPSARVGNFVETKQASLGKSSRVNHLSYVGDAVVGTNANIGAGTITCNYDGVHKHRTTIGADAFIGSNTMLVAPVKVGEGAMTASGSVITRDVPDGALAVGRARQVDRPGLARRLFERLGKFRGSGKGQQAAGEQS